jgi:hypothetical protein
VDLPLGPLRPGEFVFFLTAICAAFETCQYTKVLKIVSFRG